MVQAQTNRQDIKPGKEKLLQANEASKGTASEEEFKKDAVERKYSKESNKSANMNSGRENSPEERESFREEEEIENNEGLENASAAKNGGDTAPAEVPGTELPHREIPATSSR